MPLHSGFFRAFFLAIILASLAQQFLVLRRPSGDSSRARAASSSSTSSTQQMSFSLQPRTKKVTRNEVIIGLSSLAGLYTKMEEQHAIDVVHCALDLGFRNFDTAPHYGLGLSEERFGKALKSYPKMSRELREEIKIWTKVGRVIKDKRDVLETDRVEEGNVFGHPDCMFPENNPESRPTLNYTGDGIAQSLTDSLERIGVKHIFGIRVHDCEDEMRYNEAANKDTGAFVKIKQMRDDEKVVEDVSLGGNDPMYSLRAIRESADNTFDGVMAAGSWNLIDQDGCELYKECEKRGMYIHNAGIYASGLLVGGSTYKYGPANEEVIAKKKAWEALCEEFGNVSLPAVAMAFSVAPNVVKKFAVGVKSRFEVEKTLEWLNEIDNIDPKIWEEAKRKGLLASDCTVPSVF